MKKSFSLMIFLMAFNMLVFSQEKKDLNNLTSGKWLIESVSIENEVMNVDKEDNWMVFHTNGFYEIYLDKEIQFGTWKINKENELKIDEENFDGKSSIRELTQDEFKFSISGYTLALSKS